MIRGLTCLIVIMIASALGGALLQSRDNSYSPLAPVSATPTSQDPLNVTGSPHAFNYSYSQANLYTGSSNPPLILPAPNASGTQFGWLSTVTRTTNGTLIPRSGFRFNITSPPPPSQGRQVVNWTLTIPQFNCKNCTSVQVLFDFFGTITRGTNATYAILNGTQAIQPPVTFTALGDFPPVGTALCPEIFCVPVTRYVGYKLTLSFIFAWNGTELPGMSADVGEIEVASIGNLIPSCVAPVSCHFMQQDPTNSSSIVHNVKLSSVSYNNTLTTRVQPGSVSTTQLWWSIEAISIYYPVGYNITQIKLNDTRVYQAPPGVPLEKDHCAPGTVSCTESLFALNITDFTLSGAMHNSTLTIISTTPNSIRQLTTLSAGVPTRFFTSGDQIGINVLNRPSVVNASISQQTGQLNITFSQPLSIQPSQITTLSGGVFTFTLPSDCALNGGLCSRTWNVSAVFSSGFDLGMRSGLFGINSLQVSFTSSTGGTNAVSVQGRLTYGNGTKAPGVNATLFAIDRGTPVNTPVTNSQTSYSPARLYISNVTLVNGVFTQSQSLIMLFTIVNPNPAQAYNATVTIEHEWPGPQSHNMTLPVFLGLGDGLGDLAFTNTTAQTYEATITFTGAGVQVVVTSLTTGNPTPKPLIMTPGTSPVVPNRPHAGLFNITITSKIGNTTQTPSNSLLSPQYAYVASALVPSKYLLGSSVIKTDLNGGFSATISSNFLLGAKDLTVFLLARDAMGVGLVNNLSNVGFSDSTILLPTTDSIGTVAKGQSVTATLHLKSNSTKLTEIITVNLILQGNGISAQAVATQIGVTIAPGASQTVMLSFTAPSNTGSYTLTFSSPEYGGPLASLTLQVTILQSNLQILIPAGIGVVAAIIILGVYLIKRQPETVKSTEKTKPAGSKPKTKGSENPTSKSLT